MTRPINMASVAAELARAKTRERRPHEFTGFIVNGERVCRYCCATPREALYALGPYCDAATRGEA